MSIWILAPDGDSSCCECQPTVCDACFCGVSLDTAGGDEGFENYYDVSGTFVTGSDIMLEFNAYVIKDQLIVYADGVLKFDSGCVAGLYTPVLSIPSGTDEIRVIVVGDCEEVTGTEWTLVVACEFLPAPASSSAVLSA